MQADIAQYDRSARRARDVRSGSRDSRRATWICPRARSRRRRRRSRVARNRLPDHVRPAEERGRRDVRPEHRGICHGDERADRLRRLRRGRERRVQRRRDSSSRARKGHHVRLVSKGVACFSYRAACPGDSSRRRFRAGLLGSAPWKPAPGRRRWTLPGRLRDGRTLRTLRSSASTRSGPRAGHWTQSGKKQQRRRWSSSRCPNDSVGRGNGQRARIFSSRSPLFESLRGRAGPQLARDEYGDPGGGVLTPGGRESSLRPGGATSDGVWCATVTPRQVRVL
jgi:hypothetical protein